MSSKVTQKKMLDKLQRTSTYEYLFFFRSSTDAEVKQNPFKFVEEQFRNVGGQIVRHDKLGRKRLPVPIAKQADAFMATWIVEIGPEHLTKLNRIFTLNEQILRTNVLKVDSTIIKALSQPRVERFEQQRRGSSHDRR